SVLTVPKLKPGEFFTEASINIQLETARSFTLDDVRFDTGKSTIKSSSYKILNELLTYLKLKNDIRIEIGGHTDNVGDDASNMKLSQDRAESVMKYLISKGIAANRLTAVGYGEEIPVNTNSTSEGRQMNRRTEVRILK
ncbi:MAG: OmpA family protein, partial [Bacteroidetes bacterium]|nr:OmpA family protein [Bacteroidota bacterium]